MCDYQISHSTHVLKHGCELIVTKWYKKYHSARVFVCTMLKLIVNAAIPPVGNNSLQRYLPEFGTRHCSIGRLNSGRLARLC